MTKTTSNARVALVLLIVLAAAAAGISLMLTSYHLTEGREPWALFRLACDSEKGGCADVLASAWAVGPGGIPTALLGAVYYGALALWYLVVGRPRGDRRHWQAVPLGLNLAGAVVSVFLIGVMIGKLHEICWWCALTHLINFAMLYLGWRLWRAEGEDDWPPRRLGLAGVLLMIAWAVLCLQGLAVSNLRKSAQAANDYARRYYEDVDLQRYLQQREASALVPVRPDDPVRGNPAAPHTAVVFSDFQCPGCRAFAAYYETEIRPALGERVRLVYKHYPLNQECNPGLQATLHPEACKAADAAEAARELGGNEAFWKLHDELFQNQDAFAQNPWSDLVRKAGWTPPPWPRRWRPGRDGPASSRTSTWEGSCSFTRRRPSIWTANRWRTGGGWISGRLW